MSSGATSLAYWACAKKNENVLQEYIKMECDVNQEDFYFNTPLIKAVQISYNLNVIKHLVDCNVDVNYVNREGTSALTFCKSSDYTALLTSKGARNVKNSTEGMSQVAINIKNNNSYSEIKKEEIDTVDERGLTPFLWAIWYNREKYIENYLKLGADINQSGHTGITPLMMAVLTHNLNLVKKLIEKKAKVNQLDKNGFSALCYWNWHKSFDDQKIISYLIENGAEIDFCGEMKGKTPLMLYTLQNKEDGLYYFMWKKYIDFNFIDNDGNSILSYAILNENKAVAYDLIQRGANVNACGPKGKTPLSWAVFTNNKDLITFLLENGADINLVDYQGKTALFYAKQYKYEEIEKLLIEMKAEENVENAEQEIDVFSAIKNENVNLLKKLITNDIVFQTDKYNKSPIEVAIETKNFKILDVLIKNKKIFVHTALSFAIEKNSVEIVLYLLENGADVNRIPKKINQSPLLQAINNKNKEIVELLLMFNADPNTNESKSPLRRAVELKQSEIVKILIDNKADINEISDNGESILEMAVRDKDINFILFFLENGADPSKVMTELKRLSETCDEIDVALTSTRNNIQTTVKPKIPLFPRNDTCIKRHVEANKTDSTNPKHAELPEPKLIDKEKKTYNTEKTKADPKQNAKFFNKKLYPNHYTKFIVAFIIFVILFIIIKS